MASIQKIKRDNSIRYRVQIRRKGFSSISRIFESKELALNLARRLVSSAVSLRRGFARSVRS